MSDWEKSERLIIWSTFLSLRDANKWIDKAAVTTAESSAKQLKLTLRNLKKLNIDDE